MTVFSSRSKRSMCGLQSTLDVDQVKRLIGTLLAVVVVAACGSAYAQNAPLRSGFPVIRPGKGTTVMSQPVIADLGLASGTKQIIYGTLQGDLNVLRWNGTVW